MTDKKGLLLGAVIGGAAASVLTIAATSKNTGNLLESAKANIDKFIGVIDKVQEEGLTFSRSFGNGDETKAELLTGLEKMRAGLAPHQTELHHELDQFEAKLKEMPDSSKFKFTWNFYNFTQNS